MAIKRHNQTQLAEVLGISQQSVSRRLDGKQALTLDEVSHIAQWLEVNPQQLLIPAAA